MGGGWWRRRRWHRVRHTGEHTGGARGLMGLPARVRPPGHALPPAVGPRTGAGRAPEATSMLLGTLGTTPRGRRARDRTLHSLPRAPG
eukprot:7067853-Pyramimonas_sp.AAC.2